MPASDSPVRSGARPPRSFSFTNLPLVRQLVDLVVDGDKGMEIGMEQPQAPKLMRRSWSVDDFATIKDGGRCPYSAVVKSPDVPSKFCMPLHYPRFSKAEYSSMPEWQVDRLLEEYGLPASAMGTLDEKRDYAMGAFLWK